MDITGIFIVACKFAYLDEILLRQLYELSLDLRVQNLVNHSDPCSDGHVIPVTRISNCEILRHIYPSNRKRGVGRRRFFVCTCSLYASSAARICTTTYSHIFLLRICLLVESHSATTHLCKMNSFSCVWSFLCCGCILVLQEFILAAYLT
jgi:hypothetical protein